MYLKKLELVGFKSFPEKTQFVFNTGITCIVGPNGCGKTNLLDALRWVLGEQKTSLLRGNKMEEVIFAGTRTLKPLGMAEVSLHIDNRTGGLPSQYGEITISRRLFRSGESEYLLNKVPCRLKDISDLFADTGLGSHAYSIIQQDMIDAILSDRAEDRRFLFEEAAGITKYKHRKKAAERKLEATEQDLLRLKDILSEVTTHVTSLKRQVNKAERYKQISEELKGWNLYLARVKYDQLLERKKEQALAVRAHEDRKLAAESQLDARFADLEQRRTTMTDLDHTLTDQSNTILSLSEEAHRLESDIMVKREKRENLARLTTANHEEIIALTRRAEVLAEEKRRAENDQEGLRGEMAAAAERLEQALAAQRKADDDYLQYRAVANDESERLVALEGRISSGRTDSANVEEQVRELQAEIDQQNTRKSTINEEKGRRRQEIASLQDRLASLRSGIATSEGAIEDRQRYLTGAETDLDRLRDRMAELSSAYEATLARRNLLAEMVEHYEGYGSGVVAIFEVADRWPAVAGTVADVIRPHAGMQAAIEAALGEAAQYILCQNHDSAREAVVYLRANKAGRATFLITDKLPMPTERPALPAVDGVTGWADSLVACEEGHGRVAWALLGRTIVCQTIDAARAALEVLPDGYRAVTTGGDVLTGFGAFTGGASEEISLIGRKDEIAILDGKVRALDDDLAAARKTQSELTLSIAEQRQNIERARQAVDDDKERLNDLTASLKEEQFKINAADEILTAIDQRVFQLAQKMEKLQHRQYTLSLDFDQLDREKATVAAAVQSRKDRLAELEAAAHAAAEEVNRLQVARIELDGKVAHLASQVKYYEEMLGDIAATVEQKKQQIGEADVSSAEMAEQLRRDETALKDLFDRRQEANAAHQQLRQRHDELMAEVAEMETQVRSFRREKELAQEEIHKQEIAATELHSRMEQIEEQVRREFSREIPDVEAVNPNPEMSDDQAAAYVDDLRDRLEKMGIVNLLALEEYDQQRERQEFLSRQLDDLITAKGTLKATILKINQTARALFLETMDKARENFKRMYEALFTGGEADVILVDPDNPLESPIEIISRPRGKRPLTIMQLSGGERALTAISLLFALYMVKPSPFCFLDEIDAPLDDVNVGRFLTIVRTFSRQTQFIIITHNKITMEAADTLYGVTMEEPGVSKVVAVRFKSEAEDVETILETHYAGDDDLIQAG